VKLPGSLGQIERMTTWEGGSSAERGRGKLRGEGGKRGGGMDD